jgi:sarcosine oxidase subunit beta|tara:strand:- start:407 stop:712 length:306 start_codon:yes stop_codon:yes gene_type:complete
MRQQKTADFIIIGGGIIGCSTAYNLVNQGAKNVVVLEKGEICSGGTAKSCAITRSHYSIEANLHHAVESIKILKTLMKLWAVTQGSNLPDKWFWGQKHIVH